MIAMAELNRQQSRGGSGGWLVAAGVLLLGAGAVLAIRKSSEGTPADAPQLPDPSGNTGIVPPHLRDGAPADPPEAAPAVPEVPAATPAPNAPAGSDAGVPAEKQIAAVENYNRAVTAWNAYLADLAAGLKVDVAQLQEAKGTLKTVATITSTVASVAGVAAKIVAGASTAAAAANAVPIVGQVAAAVALLIAYVAKVVDIWYSPRGLLKSELDKGVNIRQRPPEVTGWRDGTYFLFDVPVFGPEAESFFAKVNPQITQGIWRDQVASLLRLTKAFPYGPDVARVDVTSDGVFQYTYNRLGNNDQSFAAQQRNEVYMGTTRDPAEITPFGPTGKPLQVDPKKGGL